MTKQMKVTKVTPVNADQSGVDKALVKFSPTSLGSGQPTIEILMTVPQSEAFAINRLVTITIQ